MKNLILASAILASSVATNAMAQTTTELFTAKLEERTIPIELISKVKKDFPDNKIVEYRSFPMELIGENWVVKTNPDADPNTPVDTYQVEMLGKDSKVSAIYSPNGNLISYRAKLKNVALPLEIDKKISEMYPGWIAAKDHETITVNKKNETSKYYKVEIKKGKEKMHLLFNKDLELEKSYKI
jgi:hypothetical protein